MNLCIDCKHYKAPEIIGTFFKSRTEELCMREFELKPHTSPVDGKTEMQIASSWLGPSMHDPIFERWAVPVKGGFMDGAVCSPDGIFWKAKDATPQSQDHSPDEKA